YVLLKDKSYAGTLENELATISKKRYSNLTLESRDKAYRFYLQPLNGIIPGPMLSNNLGKALPTQLLWVIGVFALIILISAGFNYNSLSVAKSLSRAKEIGVRKVSGALRHHLIYQFLTESVFTALLAFVMAGTLFHFFLKPFFQGLGIFHDLNVEMNEDVSLFFLFATFCIVVGIITGIFPALYLSSFNALQSIKDSKQKFGSTKLGFRKVLLVSQFAAALIFVITLINVYRQINYVTHADYGFRKDNIINVDLQRNDYKKVSHAFTQNSNVVNVSGISHSIGTWNDRNIDVRVKSTDEKTPVRDYSIDDHYINNLGLSLIAGKNFSPDLPANRELLAIVNESFVQHFKLGTPGEALNKSILLGDTKTLSIAGVVKDFHFKPFTDAIEPLLLRYKPNDISQLNVQLTGVNNKKTIAQLTQIWKGFDHTQSFSYKYFNDELKDTYNDYNDITYLIEVVAFMAVVVACLGFLGMIILLAKQRVKEISIRKVLGASIAEISFLLSRNFIRLLLIASAIGLPLGIILNTLIFEEFAYRVNGIAGYAGGVVLLFIVGLLTISSEIFRSATVNPVNSLRTE
ncbi:MAG: FtsX-like permease family protein, partial [Bacteroidota bacterium]